MARNEDEKPAGLSFLSVVLFWILFYTFQVRKRVAVILREHLPDDFLPPPPIVPTSLPLSESDQGNLVGNLPS